MNTTTNTQSNQDVYSIITTRIIELLEAGTVP
jgi:antirestriction protein ArdC